MTTNNPAVTVILPVFNAEAYISDAVESVLRQTLRNFDFIIINDGSTDRTLSILKRLAGRDARICLIDRQNTGYIAALNDGIALARSRYIARMDADDICQPMRFERQVAYLDANPDCVLVGTHVQLIDRDGAPIGPMRDVTFGHHEITQALLTRGWPIVHPSVMLRTQAVIRAGCYVEARYPNEDHDLFLRLGELGRLENLPEILLQYRKHPASVTASDKYTPYEMLADIVVEACERRHIPVPVQVTKPRAAARVISGQLEEDWGWQAIRSGNIHTARKYSLRLLRQRPLYLGSWRLLYSALRGPLQPSNSVPD